MCINNNNNEEEITNIALSCEHAYGFHPVLLGKLIYISAYFYKIYSILSSGDGY